MESETFAESTDIARAAWEWTDQSTMVHVIGTGAAETAAALREAAKFARFAGVEVCVDVFYVVPFALPVDQPDIPVHHLRARFDEVVAASGVDAVVYVHLCRSKTDSMRRCFPPPSVVYVGSRGRWRHWKEQRLARLLRNFGHSVTLVPSRST